MDYYTDIFREGIRLNPIAMDRLEKSVLNGVAMESVV